MVKERFERHIGRIGSEYIIQYSAYAFNYDKWRDRSLINLFKAVLTWQIIAWPWGQYVYFKNIQQDKWISGCFNFI